MAQVGSYAFPGPSRVPAGCPGASEPRATAGALDGAKPRTSSRYYEEKAPELGGSWGYGENTSKSSFPAFVQRVGRLGKAKCHQQQLTAWMRAELASGRPGRVSQQVLRERLTKLEGCGSYLEFRRFVTLPDQPFKLHSASFCQQDRLCQMCAIRRSTKLVKAYVPKLATLVASGLVPYFFTFTAKNGPDLGERYQHHERTLKLFLKDLGRMRRGEVKGPPGLARVVGGVCCYEFKRGSGKRGGLWHPHVHGVVLVDGSLEASDLVAFRQAWCNLKGDADFRAQDVRRLGWHDVLLSSVQGDEGAIEAQVVQAVGGDLVEVMKYPLKLTDMAPADQWAANTSLQGRHLIRPWGCLRGVVVSRRFETDEFDGAELPYLEVVLKYMDSVGFLVEREAFIDFPSKRV